MSKIINKIKSIPANRNTLFMGGFLIVFLLAGAYYGTAALFEKNNQQAFVTQQPEAVASELPGWWYQEFFSTSVCTQENCKSEADPDGDKLLNAQEFFYKTNPFSPDTNDNGLSDGEDVALGFDPSKPGKVTFEEAASDETVLGESIVYGDQIKEVLNDLVDPKSLVLPEINNSDLKISGDNSQENVVEYLRDNKKVLDNNLGSDYATSIQGAMKFGNAAQISDLKNKAARTELELVKLTVPSDLLDYHKYSIIFLRLLPIVIDPPATGILSNEFDPAGNFWYEKTQLFGLVMEKMDLEVKRLQNKYNQ